MGKTADLAMVQKTIIDKECKSQKVITERGDCSQSWFKHLGELHKEIFLNQRQLQKHLTWAVEKKNWTVAQWSKVLFSDKSKFCFSFGNRGLESGGRVERHRIQATWSPVWSFWSQWWFGVLWRLLVLVYCVLSSPKSMQPSTRRFWSTLCFLLLTSFMEMLISFSSRTSAPAHTAKATSKWFADHYCAWFASQHAWPEPHMELMGYFQEKDEK